MLSAAFHFQLLVLDFLAVVGRSHPGADRSGLPSQLNEYRTMEKCLLVSPKIGQKLHHIRFSFSDL